MYIQLKTFRHEDISHYIVNLFNRFMHNTPIEKMDTFFSGKNGMIFAYKHETDEFKVEVTINTKRITIGNFIIKSAKSWTNVHVNIDDELESISINNKVFHTLGDLYPYLKDNFSNYQTLDTSFTFSDDLFVAVDVVNNVIQKGISHGTLHYKKGIHVYRPISGHTEVLEVVTVSDEFDDMEIKFSQSGLIFIDSSEQRIHEVSQIENISEPIITLSDQSQISYSDLYETILSQENN